MNTRGNKRAQESTQAIEHAFLELLETNKFQKISVQAICNRANVNRTTFYARYLDIYDLQEKMERNFSEELKQLLLKYWNEQHDSNRLLCEVFHFVKKHKCFYRACLSGNISVSVLNLLSQEPFTDAMDRSAKRMNFYSSCGVDYHIAFFTAGLGEIIRIWLNQGCRESPEEMAAIIYNEYHRTE